MNRILKIYSLTDSGILYIYSIRDKILINPEYQRMSDIWTLEKRQLLIDSILNGFDIPKLYFHKGLQKPIKTRNKLFDFSIIDGKQRLETIWAFIDNKFTLSEDFILFEDETVKAKNLSYSDLSNEHPKLKLIFDQKPLPIISVETDDTDIIEEMFSRLNEAVPLNAAEKRNAFGGPMAQAIREIADHRFFKHYIPFPKKRYQHREVAAKMLLLVYAEKIVDTKKVLLDGMVKLLKNKPSDKVKQHIEKVSDTLNFMSKIFTRKDNLLKTQAMTVLLFWIFFDNLEERWIGNLSRSFLLEFDSLRKHNREAAEIDISKAHYELLEFDRYSSQGINDAPSIRFRYKVLSNLLKSLAEGRAITDYPFNSNS